jgi:glutathione S-transferase
MSKWPCRGSFQTGDLDVIRERLPEKQMAANTLSILKPSVNNLCARVFVRAAGLDFDEVDVWGKKGTPEFLAKDPADLTPLLEEDGLPNGSLWESCAIMQYLCNKHGLSDFYPEDPAERAMVDSAMFYLIGTLYPLVARATYPTLGFPQYAGEVATSEADDAMKAKAAKDAADAIAMPLEAYRLFFLGGRKFIGGDSLSIADIRLAATLEFLAAIDYELPAWAKQHKDAVESALGDAYSEPAVEVREFVASTKS